jgi:hypothetical protein
MCIAWWIAPSAMHHSIMREIFMDKYDFTLGFSIMAANEIDARIRLADLLLSISKEDIMEAMQLEKKDDE